MTLYSGHACDRCGKRRDSETTVGPPQMNRDGYEPGIPEGWIVLSAWPDPITMCKACQRKAGLR